jgi:parallel beta-helix repeat protein
MGRGGSAAQSPATVRPATTRRAALTGFGTVGAAAAAATLLPAASARAATTTGGLPVLAPGDDWASVLAKTPQVCLQPGATYTLDQAVELPDGCVIVGNGATVTVAGDGIGAFTVTERRDVTVTAVRLLGRQSDPLNTAAEFDHVAIRVTRSTNVRIEGCDFTFWRGAGVVFTGTSADDYFDYRCKIRNNVFHHCYFGVSITDRGEYGILSGNSFSNCRLAIWDSAGNWAITGNSAVLCYAAYYSIAQTSPYGALTSDNWSHGSLVGNTFNHCSGGATGQWNGNTAFPIGGSTRDPGSGIVAQSVLPPTFSGNTLWYSNVSALDILGTRWLLSGSTFSNLTVSCTGDVPVHLVGTQANGTANLPTFTGNVSDLLASLS